MEIIFCANPLNPQNVDSDYIREARVVSSSLLYYSIINYEALVDDHDIEKALKRIPKTKPYRSAIYRGWMMTPEQYAIFYHALEHHGIKLINTPMQYQHCHYLPENYSIIQEMTPKTVWVKNGIDAKVFAEQQFLRQEDFSITAIMKTLEPFGNCPIILKDYVKSQKHYWHDACFISSAIDEIAVSKVVQRFLELQGHPEGGLVFREYVPFESIGRHPKSGMPLSLEYRIFFWHKKPIAIFPYWYEKKYPQMELPLKKFEKVAQLVNSHFFTMDVAKSQELGWMIVELGDGQVAGLPDNVDIKAFYQKIAPK